MVILSVLRIVASVFVTLFFSVIVILEILFVRRADAFHALARGWAGSTLWLFGITLTVNGKENVEPGRPYVYVANHASMFDIPACMFGIPDNIHIMLKKELTYVPVWGWCLAMSPYIVIDRQRSRSAAGSLEQAATAIRSGKSVLVFAEGTRTRTGALQPFKRGAFSVSAKSGVPIIPVTINNTFSILRKGSLDVRPAPISLELAPPIETSGVTDKDGELTLMERTRAAIEKTYVDQSTRA